MVHATRTFSFFKLLPRDFFYWLLVKQKMTTYRQALKLVHDLLGKEETVGELLDEVGKYMFGGEWRGVRAKDELTDLSNGMYIANLDNHDEPGSHWVGLAVQPNVIYYFDSFARPNSKTLELKDPHRVIIQEADPEIVQPRKAEDCGQRSLAWLMLFAENPEAALSI